MKDGISLLSLKHQTLLSYIQSLLLLATRRTLSHTLTERSPPSASFNSQDRDPRGNGAGDLVDSMVEGRLVLEKIKILETRMKYQIEKLVKIAHEPESKQLGGAEGNFCPLRHECYIQNSTDPLAFRPNPQNFVDANGDEGSDQEERPTTSRPSKPTDGIYRPPRLAPVPYTAATTGKAKRDRNRAPVPTALSSLVDADPSQPYIESTSGLGNAPMFASGRAKYLDRLKDYEEDNFTRLFMKKKDAKQRLHDEEDLAMGGTLSNASRGGKNRRKGGFEDEFGDILKASSRRARGDGVEVGDGYDELRQRGKKRTALERSQARISEGGLDDEGMGDDTSEGGRRKRTRFEDQARKSSKVKRKASKSRGG